MKIRLIKTAILLTTIVGVLFLTELTLSSTMRSVKVRTIGKINAVMKHQLDMNVTIWGASTAYVNFNPKIITDSLNYSVMNMGIDGTNIDQYNGLLREYLSYTTKSKYIVIALDLHGGLLDRKELYHMHNWIHHIGNDNVYECLSDIDGISMFKARNVPFYSLIMYDKHGFPYFRNALMKSNKEYLFPNNGFLPNGDKSIQLDLTNTDPFKVEIGERSLRKIKESCFLAKEKGISPIIVITPFFKEGLKKVINRIEIVTLISSLENFDIKVYDFSDCYISENPHYFKDYTHLNSIGANELTRLLVKNIKTK